MTHQPLGEGAMLIRAEVRVAAVRTLVSAANACIDAYLLNEGKAEIGGEGPH